MIMLAKRGCGRGRPKGSSGTPWAWRNPTNVAAHRRTRGREADKGGVCAHGAKVTVRDIPGETAPRLSRPPMTSTCTRSQCQDSAVEAATGAVRAHRCACVARGAHIPRNAITAAGLFIERRAGGRRVPGFSMSSKKLDSIAMKLVAIDFET